MIDITPEIVGALGTDPTLLSLCKGVNKVYPYSVPQSTPLPYIRVADINNYDDNFADNDPISSEIRYQVDVWGNEIQLALTVDNVMKAKGFSRYYSNGDWDADVLCIRKIMRYKTTKSI